VADREDKTICGTIGYIAPEVLNGKGYSVKCDIFSVGSILFNLLTCRNLFAEKDHNILMHLNKLCDTEEIG
jgi:serine/threonine protein kinase